MRQRLRVARRWRLTPSQFDALPAEDRELMLAEDELVCERCGNLRSVCGDPEIGLYPQRSMCYVTAAEAVTWRRLREKHKKNEPGTAPHPLDGLSVWMSEHDLTPDDHFV